MISLRHACPRALLLFAALLPRAAAAADGPLKELTETVAVTGYESQLGSYLKHQLAAWHPQQDSLGNITVTFGTGAPHRLLAAPIDEPGYVISHIEPNGYARLQRLPQAGLQPHYNELNNAQPMLVTTRDGRQLAAVTAGLSIHLTPGRANPPNPDDIDNLYLDLGAQTANELHAAGVDLLSPVAAERHLLPLGATQWTGTAVGDRFGAATLLALAGPLSTAKLKGSVTLAFVTQQWAGARGLTRVFESQHPDELLYLGRPMPIPRPAGTVAGKIEAPTAQPKLGSGVLLASSGAESPLARELARFTPISPTAAAPIVPKSYGAAIALPARAAHLAIPLAWPNTAAETLDQKDLTALIQLLAQYLDLVPPPPPAPRANAPAAYAPLPAKPTVTPTNEAILKTLILSYGVSERETMTREAVERLLPPWVHPTSDAGGNLILTLGKQTGRPGTVLMAHTDELGFRVRAVLPNGSLDLENKGGGSPAFYWGHPAVVHTAAGMRAAVVELPENYDTAAFHFPADFRASATLNVGAATPAEVESLGIHIGDTVTIPKRYRTLLGSRVSARSLDDRVGCAALIHAVWALGPHFAKDDLTFVWSTREELGLLGAAEYAAAANTAGQTPATVFAIDTFVSSDSPLESQRFADATLGDGFVIRAIDGSNIAPWEGVQRLQALAEHRKIPVQYGVTGGGNDGSTFLRYGAIDLALSWPLRYSHSPAETIDTRDLDALSAISETLAREW